MIIGENPRQEDMDVNPSKEKKASNVRSSTAEATEVLTPASQLSLEQALEFLREDECLEVTPNHVRLRKTILSRNNRSKARKSSTAGAR
jgi:GTP-binding protein